MEEIHYSSNVAADAFDWNTPYEHLPSPFTPISVPPPPPADIPESSHAWKRKAHAARIITEDSSPELTANPTAPADPQEHTYSAKRQIRYHIITSDTEDEGNNDRPSMQRRSTWIASHGEEKTENFNTSKNA
ncbi:hypothetical protein V6N13_109841 [Hibiscus sabdariffa]